MQMSVEALGSSETGEIIDLFGVEALLLRRKQLQQRLGGASVRLNEANREYHDCIQEIIQVNGRLLAEGVDTNALGRELQQDVPANAAVNDYGYRE
jgi:hypothetical protein